MHNFDYDFSLVKWLGTTMPDQKPEEPLYGDK